ncbi:MAG: pilin, partial [Plesiomonas sp.]
ASMKTNVESYIADNGSFPTQNASGVATIDIPKTDASIATITIGTSSLEYKFVKASEKLVGGKLTLARDSNGYWNCTVTVATDTTGILPKGCK